MEAIVGLLLLLGTAINAEQVYRADGVACYMSAPDYVVPVIDPTTGECYPWDEEWMPYGGVMDEDGEFHLYLPPSPPPTPNMPPYPDSHFDDTCEVCTWTYEASSNDDCSCNTAGSDPTAYYCDCKDSCADVCANHVWISDALKAELTAAGVTCDAKIAAGLVEGHHDEDPLHSTGDNYNVLCGHTSACTLQEADMACHTDYQGTKDGGYHMDLGFGEFTYEYITEYFDFVATNGQYSACQGLNNYCTCGRDAGAPRRRLMFGAWKTNCKCNKNLDLPATTVECSCENPWLQSPFCSCANCDDASFGKCDCFVTKCEVLQKFTYMDWSDYEALLLTGCGGYTTGPPTTTCDLNKYAITDPETGEVSYQCLHGTDANGDCTC